MERHNSRSFSYFLFLINLLLIQYSACVAVNTTAGFSLELIHIDNVGSPFYNPNLTNQQRLQRLHDISTRRLQRLESLTSINGTFIAPLQITPNVVLEGTLHTVVVGIGTPRIRYQLHLDTGSDLVWTQCQPCKRCYNQIFPIFNPGRSSTYRRIPCTDPLCRTPDFSCVDGECTYTIEYEDGSATSGTLSRETLTAPTQNGDVGVIHSFAIGCSTESTGLFSGMVAGILGMGFGAESLASQASGGSFSYCLSNNERKPSFIRFGDDVKRTSGMAQTSLIRAIASNLYYLNLIDISILGNRLNLSPGTFRRRMDGDGGCIIDSGTSLSYLISPAYKRLKLVLEEYFRRKGFKVASNRVKDLMQLDICYIQKRSFFSKMANKFKDLPNMDLHFPSAALGIPAKNLFIYNSELNAFCLPMKESNDLTVLGSFHQQGVRFIYNVNRRTLEFARDDCSRD